MNKQKIQLIIKFIFKRLLFILPQLVGVTIVVFALIRFLPGNAAYVLLGQGASDEAVAALTARMGLDKPLWIQYILFIKGLFNGDWGTSLITSNPVLTDIGQKLPATLELITYSLIIIVVLSLVIARITAIRGNKVVNKIIRGYGFLSGAFPDFWLALIIVFFLYAQTKIIPSPIGRLDMKYIPPATVTGFYTIDTLLEGSFDKFVNAWAHLAGPLLTMVICNAGSILKMAQATMVRTKGEEYVKFASDNGLSTKRKERMIFRNSLPPVLTLIGYVYILMLGGSVLVEQIFSWGGIGQYSIMAISNSDYAPMQAVVLIMAIISFIAYLVLDIIYFSIDMRVEL